MPQEAPPALILEIKKTLKQLEIQNFYERLDLAHDAESKEIRKAYMKLAARWHPDRFTQYNLGSNQPLVQRVFALVTEAHTTLSNTAKKQEYDDELAVGSGSTDVAAILGADSEFRLGFQLLERGQVKGAHKKFKIATEGNPSSLEYQAYYQWTSYLTLPRDVENRPVGEGQKQTTIDTVKKALEEAENFDMGWVFLGRICVDEDNLKQAKKHFNTALSLNPRNFQAQRQLRLLNMRDEGGGGGGFFDKLKALFTKKR